MDGFKDDPPEARLVVDLDGFEGPIDVLLALAREQKVDLTRISVLALADQYLAFVARLRHEHLEIAADYLVMAAWLAYLKSRLLLPDPPAGEDEPTGAELAEALRLQLLRLEAMQKAGATLMALPRLGREVFARGAPEGVERIDRPVWDVRLYDLLKAYADHRRKHAVTTLHIEAPDLYSMDDAIARLNRLLGHSPGWSVLRSFLPDDLAPGLVRRSALASHFVAALELARQGRLVLRQDGGPFSDIHVRAK